MFTSSTVSKAKIKPSAPAQSPEVSATPFVPPASASLPFAAAGLALFSWIEMIDAKRTLEGECDAATKGCSGATADAALEAKDDGQTWRTVNYASWGVAIAGLAAGAWLILTNRPKASTVSVGLAPLHGGATVSAGGHF